MKIGEKIRRAREDMDMSQQQMADLIPMNQSNYSKIERDFQQPSLDQLKRIVEILHIDLYALFDIPVQRNESDIRFAEKIKQLYKQYYE